MKNIKGYKTIHDVTSTIHGAKGIGDMILYRKCQKIFGADISISNAKDFNKNLCDINIHMKKSKLLDKELFM